MFVPEKESELVDVEAVRKIDKFQAAIERTTSSSRYKKQPGERYIPRLHLRGEEWPTYKDWIESQIKEASEEE